MVNDTYEIWNEEHKKIIEKYIPPNEAGSIKEEYDTCHYRLYFNESIEILSNKTNFTLVKCHEWVYSKQYFESTLITEV